MPKGEIHPNCKLTEEQAKKIKYNLKNLTLKQVAEIYNISYKQVSKIRIGKNWSHI